MFVLETYGRNGGREIWYSDEHTGVGGVYRERMGRWETDGFVIQNAIMSNVCPEGWYELWPDGSIEWEKG